jgi:4-amino-4-deoxy-L-arabinose transferase-like glycosyltransferase
MTPKTWRLFTAIVFTVLLLPALVQQGMFLDGVSYACIARNMAIGLGDFSHPHYTTTLYPVCYEQPPLVYWLQSLFFRLLGDHFWVERLYAICMAVVAGIGIILNGRLVQGTSSERLRNGFLYCCGLLRPSLFGPSPTTCWNAQ